MLNNHIKLNDYAFSRNRHCDQPTSQLLLAKGSARLVHLDYRPFYVYKIRIYIKLALK